MSISNCEKPISTNYGTKAQFPCFVGTSSLRRCKDEGRCSSRPETADGSLQSEGRVRTDALRHRLPSGAGRPQASLIGSHRWILKPEFLRDDDPGGPKRVSRERERHSVQSLSQCSRKEGKRHQERPRTMRFLFFVNKVQRNE